MAQDPNAAAGQFPEPASKYNVRVFGGTKDRVFLSCTHDGEKVDLWNKDDVSGRQRWFLINAADGSYNIQVFEGIKNDRRFLSCTDDGTKVDLWGTDDASGRQRWKFTFEGTTKDGHSYYTITISGGVKGDRKYLSCTQDGTKVDLWKENDKSGRQLWIFEKL